MTKLRLISPGHPLRNATERLVKDVYANHYGARISGFPDTLAALVTSTGEPYCAAGLRLGLPDCFSEVYLEDEVQNLLSLEIGERVFRSDIMEVTSLVSNRIGSSFVLLREILLYGRECDMRYGVFTITQRLRRVIQATRVPLIEFSPARKSRISNPEDWGTYYDNNPWVCGLADTFLIGAESRRLSPASCLPETWLEVA